MKMTSRTVSLLVDLYFLSKEAMDKATTLKHDVPLDIELSIHFSQFYLKTNRNRIICPE